MFSKVIKSLKETLEEILSFVQNFTFAFIFLVMQEPEGIALFVKLLEQLINCLTTLVRVIDEESLEIEKVKFALWKQVKWVLSCWLILKRFFFLLLWLSCGRLWCSNFFLLSFNQWL